MTNHSVTISGLEPATTHHFRVRTIDGAGNETVSQDATFVTPATDTVTIISASWKANPYGVLSVQATGSDPGAVLTVYSGDGGYYGDMDSDGNGSYFKDYSSSSKPATIEVRSSLGAVATPPVE